MKQTFKQLRGTLNMQSDHEALIRKVITRYPEVFESLLEFERLKRIPKLYCRQRLNVTIDENILRDFKGYCAKNTLNISRFVERRMLDELKKR